MVAAEKCKKKNGIQRRLKEREERGECAKLDEMAQKMRRVISVIRKPKEHEKRVR